MMVSPMHSVSYSSLEITLRATTRMTICVIFTIGAARTWNGAPEKRDCGG